MGIKKEEEIVPRTTTEEVFNFQDSYHEENVALAPLNEETNDNKIENEEEEEEETNIEETTVASTTGLAKVQQIRDNFAATIDAKLASPPPQMTHSKVPSMTIPNIALTTEDTRESAE